MFWPSLLACVAPYVFFLGPPVCFPQFCMVLPSLLHSLPRLNGLERGVCQLSVPPFAGCMHLSCVESSMYVLTFTFGLRCFIFHGFSPHLCVGFLFLILYPAVRRPPPVVLPSVTHNLLTHNLSSHHTTCPPLVITQLVITPLVITPLVITPLAHTQLVIKPLAHTQLVLTQLVITQLALTQLAHTELLHIHTHNLSSHTELLHIHTHTTCPHTTWHRRSLCVAGVALTALGRLWWRAGFPNDAVAAAALCVAGVALGDIDVAGVALGDMDLHFAWQAWHLATCIFTWWHRRSLCVAGVALTALGRLWWRAGFPNDAVATAALCVAGVALGDIDCHFAWHLVTSSVTLRGRRGRRGTWRHVSSLGDIDAHFCVAGVALTALGQLWWRAGFPNDAVAAAAFLRGRRGTWWHRLSLCVAGVALGDMDLHFAW